jgi:uncharacterized protein (TIGR02145 family)
LKVEREFQIKLRMKKHILFLGLLLIVFGLRLDAQTLKNIHRQNQPVLRIPTHLIDKVETAEVNGAQVLQVRQLNGYVSEIPLSQIDSITHSEGEAVDPAQLGDLRTASVMGVVIGPTGAPEMNAIVRSPYGGEETQTDLNGVFFLDNILVYDKLGYITITKPGFHQGSRSFLPLSQGRSRINVELLPMVLSGSFSSSSGGTTNAGLLQLAFPANAIQRNGQPYTGQVNVYAQALDPSAPEMFNQMPGELLGGIGDSLQMLRSFGMASIELRDAEMNELQLLPGLSASLTFNIPTALLAEAPATIDWWSYDETQGFWIHEGIAQKQGNQYVGQATHFSWWNCDKPENFNNLIGVVNSVGGTPVSDAQVNVVTPSLGTGVTYTNAEGVFSGRVPKNQLLTIEVKIDCSGAGEYNLVHSESIASAQQPLSTNMSIDLSNRYPINGVVQSCSTLQPVASGYVKMGTQIVSANEGAFTLWTCGIGQNSFYAFDTSNPDTVFKSLLNVVQVQLDGANAGNIPACQAATSLVADNQGYVYPTIYINNRWWLAENLNATHFADGSEIPLITDNTNWLNLSTPAYSNYGNLTANEELYGKLYNWATVSDPRNVCPVGWYVPTDAEWTDLTTFLGGTSNAGGKLKSITGWNAPNASATNESGFSALPGGYRTNDGAFSGINLNGSWWSSTENNVNDAWLRNLSYGNGIVNRYGSNKKSGFSVRCIKD